MILKNFDLWVRDAQPAFSEKTWGFTDKIISFMTIRTFCFLKICNWTMQKLYGIKWTENGFSNPPPAPGLILKLLNFGIMKHRVLKKKHGRIFKIRYFM